MRIRFADLELDTQRFILRRGHDRLRLRPKVFDLLIYLVMQRTRVVPREELVERLWGTTRVGEGSLSGLVNELRQRLGERGDGASSIRTVHARGYQFVAEVISEEPNDRDAMSSTGSRRETARTAGPMGHRELLALFETEGINAPPVTLLERLLAHLGDEGSARDGVSRPQSSESESDNGLISTRRMRAVRPNASRSTSGRETG